MVTGEDYAHSCKILNTGKRLDLSSLMIRLIWNWVPYLNKFLQT
ncbi:Uncharacterised protein [uncultured archaeon]|nr:Uncharacterised protein [uncultured archaeon]